MQDHDYQRLSFQATIAFDLMALFLLGLAGFALGDPAVLFCSLAVAGLSYAAQFCYTLNIQPDSGSRWHWRLLAIGIGIGAQLLACIIFAWAAFRILGFA